MNGNKQGRQKKEGYHHSSHRGVNQLSTSAIKRSGCTILKQDGTVIDVDPRSDSNTSVDGGVHVVSSLKENSIRNEVEFTYFDYDLPALAEELKSCYRDALSINAQEASGFIGIHINGNVEIKHDSKKKEVKPNLIKMDLSYACLDDDGKIVLAIKEINGSEPKIYFKVDDSRELLFNLYRKSDPCPFVPVKEALNDDVFWGKIKKSLQFLNVQTDKSFNKFVKRLRAEYLHAIGNYFILLERHRYFAGKTDKRLKGESAQKRQEIIPYAEIGHGIALYERGRQKVLHNGDKICCQLSTIVIVVNTFHCLSKHHDMVKVTLEVLIKDKEKDLPFIREMKAYYCKQCKKVFMYTSEFNSLNRLILDRRYLIFNRFDVSGKKYGYAGELSASWAEESVLKEAGYEVNRNSSLSQRQRLGILVALNKRGVSYHVITSYLNTFITVLGSSSRDMSQAISRWKSDLEVLREMYFAKVIK